MDASAGFRPVRLWLVAIALLFVVGALPVHAAATDAAAPTIEWERLVGGAAGFANADLLFLEPANDGGYIFLGFGGPMAGGEGPFFGWSDLWVAKLDATGGIEWQHVIGGAGVEYPAGVRATTDGGYILLGETDSSASGDVTGTTHGGTDIWVVKIDAMGAIQWQRLLGGSGGEEARSVRQTPDGGYVVLGESLSNISGTVTGTNRGKNDVYAAKLDGAGAVQWERLLGGSEIDLPEYVAPTADGGCILTGIARSSTSGDVTGANHGNYDVWVVKLDGAGAIRWQRLLGGSLLEVGSVVEQTRDGGYILAGHSQKPDGDVDGPAHGGGDVWIVNLDSGGAIRWQRLVGGLGTDIGYDVRQTADGGYILAGSTASSASGDVTEATHGSEDIWVVRLDATGSIQWQRLLGSGGRDRCLSVRETVDRGYLLLGAQPVNATTATGMSMADLWMVKLTGSMSAIPGAAGYSIDTDDDGLCDDVNGNGRRDFADIVLYFNRMSWIAENAPVAAFDYNGNGGIDFSDVVWLFNHLASQSVRTYTVTAVAIGPGRITPSGRIAVPAGGNITFTLTSESTLPVPHDTQSGYLVANVVRVDPTVTPTPYPDRDGPWGSFTRSYTLRDVWSDHTVYGCFNYYQMIC